MAATIYITICNFLLSNLVYIFKLFLLNAHKTYFSVEYF